MESGERADPGGSATSGEGTDGGISSIGLTFDGYRLLEVIGQGGMGMVYRAQDVRLGRVVAIKVLNVLGGLDAKTAARLRQEARAIAQLRHPNILQVYQFGEVGRTPYMVVEYLEAGSVARRLAGGQPPDPGWALAVLRGISAALDHAHERGVVHRDVKPGNILLRPDGEAVLADFGIAKIVDGSVRSLTGTTAGTPSYMAPEQVLGGQVGAPADVYALATVAYELLTGRVPFASDGSLYSILYAHVKDQPTPPSWRRPELPEDVDPVLLKGLAKEPGERWSSCTEMVAALKTALEPGRARRKSWPAGPRRVAAAISSGLGRGRHRPRALALAAAVLLTAGLALPAVAWLRSQPSDAAASWRQSSSSLPDSGSPAGPAALPGAPSPTPGGAVRATLPPASTPSPSKTTAPAVRPSGPLSTPTPTRAPTPTPSPAPTAATTPGISVMPSPLHVHGDYAVSGKGWQPGVQITVWFEQGANLLKLDVDVTSASGTFFSAGTLPDQVVAGPAVVKTCDPRNVCSQQPVTVAT